MQTKTALVGTLLSLLVLAPGLAQADRRQDCDKHYGRPQYSQNPGYHWGSRPNNTYNFGRRPNAPYPNVYGLNDSAVKRGIWSGQLTNREVRDLQQDKWNIQRETAAYWSDGRLSRSEREDLRDDISDYNRQLNHNLRDGERRNYYRW